MLSGFHFRQDKTFRFFSSIVIGSEKISHWLSLNLSSFQKARIFQFIVIAVPRHQHFVIGRHTCLETTVILYVHFAGIRICKMLCGCLILSHLSLNVVG